METVETQSVSGTPGAVGGAVVNTAPAVVAFTQGSSTGENRGAFVVDFSGTVSDPNTETQIRNISVVGTGPLALGGHHQISPDDRAALTEPNAFGADGFRVWTATPRDGVLHFRYRQTFPALAPPGTYSFLAFVADTPGLLAMSAPLTVTVMPFSDVTIDATPVDAAGAPMVGQSWGQWSAEANARNVAATNYIKLVNTGQVADARLVVDFAEHFVGAEDANFTIPVADNLQLAWWEDTTPGTTSPGEGEFSFEPANADGSGTLSFSGIGNVIYVTYRIVQLPSPLPVQNYGISFTVTEL